MLYNPRTFRANDMDELHKFIQQYSFCSLITHSSSWQVSHIPLLLQPQDGKYGTLIGHIAKPNRQWQDFDGTRQALCIFNGPHSYISPSWYITGPDAPTWNYAVVHAEGIPHIMDNQAELLESLNCLINHFEPSLQEPNSKAYIPQSYKLSQLDYIVGFKIEIQQLVGKFKLGQNYSTEDQQAMLENLSKQDNEDSRQLAHFIKQYRKEKL